MALLSGTSVWFGLFGLLLTWAFVTVFRKKTPVQPEEKDDQDVINTPPVHNRWGDIRGALVWALGTLLVLGSLFLVSPMGLPAIIMSFVASLRGWWILSDIPVWRPLLALPAYEILPLGFGIAGIPSCWVSGRCWRWYLR